MNQRPTSEALPCTLTEADDRRVVGEVLSGNKSAFATLVDRYEKPLFNTALRMTGDSEDAKDIIQVAFIKAYEKLDTFKPEHKFFSWLYRIVVNETFNHIRTRDRYQELDPDMASTAMDPEECFAQAQSSDRIRKALLRLPPEHNALILMRYFDQMSYREMGYVLNIPEKTVKSRLYSARQLLADLLR